MRAGLSQVLRQMFQRMKTAWLLLLGIGNRKDGEGRRRAGEYKEFGSKATPRPSSFARELSYGGEAGRGESLRSFFYEESPPVNTNSPSV
jgi:hypothetical protein